MRVFLIGRNYQTTGIGVVRPSLALQRIVRGRRQSGADQATAALAAGAVGDRRQLWNLPRLAALVRLEAEASLSGGRAAERHGQDRRVHP